MIDAIRGFITNNSGFFWGLVTFVVIIVVAFFVIRILKSILARFFARNDKLTPMMENLLLSIIDKILWIITILVALPKLGIDVAPLIAGFGALTFVAGFAFQESLSNFAAGFMISLNTPFRLGHYIETAGENGTVKDLSFMATTLTTPDNKEVIIPNRLVWGNVIVNYSATGTRRVDMVIGISYSSNIGTAVDVINKILNEQQEIHEEPAPLVEVLALADSSVNLAVRFWLDSADYWNVYFRVNRLIKEALEEAGVDLPFPQMDLHIKEAPSTN